MFAIRVCRAMNRLINELKKHKKTITRLGGHFIRPFSRRQNKISSQRIPANMNPNGQKMTRLAQRQKETQI
jgi:hypothetical protein